MESKLWESCVPVTGFFGSFREIPPNRKFDLMSCLCLPLLDRETWVFTLTRRECEVIGEKPAYAVGLLQGIIIISVFCWLEWELSLCFLAYSSSQGSPIRKFWISEEKRILVDSTWQVARTAEHAVIAELVCWSRSDAKTSLFAGFQVLCE